VLALVYTSWCSPLCSLLLLVMMRSLWQSVGQLLLSTAACCLWPHCPHHFTCPLPYLPADVNTVAIAALAAAAAAGGGSVVAVNSCLLPVASLGGCHIITSEGLGNSRSGFHEVHGESLRGQRVTGVRATGGVTQGCKLE
jgi:hypothetical protein